MRDAEIVPLSKIVTLSPLDTQYAKMVGLAGSSLLALLSMELHHWKCKSSKQVSSLVKELHPSAPPFKLKGWESLLRSAQEYDENTSINRRMIHHLQVEFNDNDVALSLRRYCSWKVTR